jgi:hypothetical protein
VNMKAGVVGVSLKFSIGDEQHWCRIHIHRTQKYDGDGLQSNFLTMPIAGHSLI